MAFYSYIILDGYRYKTLSKQWRPAITRPASPRLTLLGNLETTFGVGALKRWAGLISVPHGETAPEPADGSQFGNIVSLRDTLIKRSALTFVDHNGITYSEAVLTGPFEEESLVSVWNSATNKYFVQVQITAKA